MEKTISAWQQDAALLCAKHKLRCRAKFEEDKNKKQLAATSYFRTVKVSPKLIANAGAHRIAIIAHELGHQHSGHSYIQAGLSLFLGGWPIVAFDKDTSQSHWLAYALGGTLLSYAANLAMEIYADNYAARLIGQGSVKSLLEWINSPETDFRKTLLTKIRLRRYC